jgi:Flp pilus assembly protein TadB
MRTQHLCPFCGAVMHESGGGFRPIFWILVTILGMLAAVAYFANQFPNLGSVFVYLVMYAMGGAFWWVVGSAVYRMFKKIRRP